MMVDPNPRLARLSDEDRRLLEGWLVDFDLTWRDGELARRVRSLPPHTHPLRLAALGEMVKIDFERQWQHGRRPRLEGYLHQYPELGTPDSVPLDLIRAECEVRRRFGDPPSRADLERRFPRRASDLALLSGSADDEAAPLPGRAAPETRASSHGETITPDAIRELAGRFGRYEILGKLGAGGMGSVYLARDTRLNRKVALKVPRDAAGQAAARFLREAQAAATLSHPNICPVYDFGQIDGVPYLTMGYVEGRALGHAVGGRPLDQRDAAAVVRKLALALHEAHARGVVHRDLKPANVMIDHRGEPVVMDFGLARRVEDDGSPLTRVGSVLGTPAYMAPEQVGGEPGAVGPACDVYGLGVILYELLTGSLPFEGPAVSVLAQLLTQEPPPPSAHRADLDPALDAICRTAMAKHPAGRYASMADFAAALERYLITHRPRRRPPPWLGWVLGGAAALFLAGAVIYVNTNRGTIRIELSDPAAQVEVRVNGDVVSLEGGGTTLRLRVGENQLIVEGRGFETVSESFTVRRGNNPVYKVSLEPAHVITNSIGMKLARVPAGRFHMGAPKHEPDAQSSETLHPVEITRSFHIGVHEVTQREYEAVARINPSWFCAAGEGKDKVAGLDTAQFPVEMVSWEDAQAFCHKLSALPAERAARRVYRLPTEAEWEYACRAGSQTAYQFGNAISSKDANIDGRLRFGGAARGPFLERTTAVGSYPANALGLHDMHGNVWEWCHDWLDLDYYSKKSAELDPTGPEVGELRVCRGGGWFDVRGAGDCRCANRGWYPPGARQYHVGFRVVCVSPSATLPGLLPVEGTVQLPAPVRGAGKPIDLLALLDLDKTFFHGEWKVRHGALVSPQTFESVMRIPYVPPEEYRLTLVVERAWYKQGLLVALPVGKRMTAALLDSSYGPLCGLHFLDGKPGWDNETTIRGGTVLREGRRSTLVCTVRRGHIEVTCDGRPVINWKGDPKRLSTPPQVKDSAMFLQTWSIFYMYRMELLPLSGAGRVIVDYADELRRLPTQAPTHCVAFSRDGQHVVSAGADPFLLRTWEAGGARPVRFLEGHRDLVRQLVYSPDGRRILSAGDDGTARLWDAETGECKGDCTAHPGGSVSCLAFSSDGGLAATGGNDGLVRLWDPRTLETSLRRANGLRAEYFADRELKVKVGEGREAFMDWTRYYTVPHPALLAGSHSARWTGWLKAPRPGRYHLGVICDDGGRLWLDGKQLIDAWRAQNPTAYYVDVELGREPHALRIDYFQNAGAATMSLRWSREGTMPDQPVPPEALFRDLAVARTAVVRPVKERHTLKGHTGTVWAVAFSPDGTRLLSAGDDGGLRLWSAATGELLHRLGDQTFIARAVRFTPDGRQAVSGNSDRTIRWWDLETGRELRRSTGHEAAVTSLALSADGRHLLSGSEDRTVRLWDIATGKELHRFTGHTDKVLSVDLSPDGLRAVSGSLDSTVRVWALPRP